MTLRVLLLRHGEAAGGLINDFDRPLTSKGQRQVIKRGLFLRQEHIAIDHVFCSSALRTRETLFELNLALSDAQIEFDRNLYLAQSDYLFEHLRLLDDDYRSVLLIGHNPGIHQLALDLLRQTEQNKQENQALSIHSSYPTAALAGLRFDCPSWSTIKPHSAALDFYQS
ncbi:MAG: histidine phosphatase family protein [Commensalibacter sp.]|nr:histidine phosphatase family protein [Commensalibacter sp.]